MTVRLRNCCGKMSNGHKRVTFFLIFNTNNVYRNVAGKSIKRLFFRGHSRSGIAEEKIEEFHSLRGDFFKLIENDLTTPQVPRKNDQRTQAYKDYLLSKTNIVDRNVAG